MSYLTNSEILSLWDSEIEKKLFRCSKELGVYNQIKKSIGKWEYSDISLWQRKKFFSLCDKVFENLTLHDESIVYFDNMDTKINYPVVTALKDERHFCHLLVLHIIMAASLNRKTYQKLFQEVSKEIFKRHYLHTKYVRIKGFLKIFFS